MKPEKKTAPAKQPRTGTNSHHSAPVAAGAKSPAQVRADFDRKGVAIAAWARDHKVGASLVYEILSGRKKCHRGKSHRIAVLLGLKVGELVGSTAAVNHEVKDAM